MIRGSNCLKLFGCVAVILWLLFASLSFPAEKFKAADHFSKEEIETAARFNRYLYILFFGKQIAVLLFLGLVAWSRLASSYQRDVEKVCFRKRRAVLPVYAFFLLLMIRLVAMPFDAVRDLVVKTAFGLNSQGISGWLVDQMKSFVAADIWYVPFVIVVYGTIRRLRRTWWLVSAGAVGMGLIVWYSVAPHLVEPLFYRLTPIKSKVLRHRLDPLLEKSGFPPNALYQADSGKRTREVNAYLSGLFLGRRIVLYDVLAEEADRSEIEFVVAHEIAHWKNNHIIKEIAWTTAGAAGCLLLVGILLKLTSEKKKRRGTQRYEPSSLPAFFFWLHVILFLVMPLECAVSRRFERTADRHALELMRDPQAAVRLFQKVARRNLSDLNPPPLVKFWLYTHPTIPERIQAALTMATKPLRTIRPRRPVAPPAKTPSAPEPCSPVLPGTPRLQTSRPARLSMFQNIH